MKALRLAFLLLLAAPPAAHAADGSVVSRDLVPRGRTPAAVGAPHVFDVVGLHWRGPGTVLFRTRAVSGRWSKWRAAAPEGEDLPDAGVEAAHKGWRLGNPWWAPRSDRIEVRTRGRVDRVRAWFVTSTSARVPLRHVSVAGSPTIIPRSSWQADERIVRAAPRYAPVLREAVVHHTAGSNAYRPEESAAIVRGIELYHVKANGWNDIGYNLLVDRYGQVFEGRAGGIDKNVIGAHAQGFNTGSVGVALIGMYSSVAPTRAAEAALEQVLAWRLDVAHVDPAWSGMVASGGNPKYTVGTPVYLRAISGHRDTGFTACPGNRLYARLGAITEVVATTGLPKLYQPVVRGTIGSPIRFSARLSQPLAWTLTVTGPGGERVVRKSGTGDRISWSWDSNGRAPGRYVWTMEAGASVRPARGVIGGTPVPVARAPLPVSDLGLLPRIVSPNGDGYSDTTTIRYRLVEPSTVNVRLEDAKGATVLALVTDVHQGAGEKVLAVELSALSDGGYRVVVRARGDSGSKAMLVDDLLVMRALGWVRADPAELSPNGDGVSDTTLISFALQGGGQVAVEVRDGNHPVALLLVGWFDPGAHGVVWNGHAGSGLLGAGSYSVWVTLSNAIGTITQKVPITVTG
jgi:N-acetylmuramoyl-L-alanine amidase